MVPVKTFAFLQKENCKYRYDVSFDSNTKAEVGIRTKTNKYSDAEHIIYTRHSILLFT